MKIKNIWNHHLVILSLPKFEPHPFYHTLSISPPEKWILFEWSQSRLWGTVWGGIQVFSGSPRWCTKKSEFVKRFTLKMKKNKYLHETHETAHHPFNRKRVIEVAELPIFSFLELLANTPKAFFKNPPVPCGWGFKGVWGLFHKTVHLTSCMRVLTRWAPSLVINGVILTINGLIHVSHWWLFHPLTSLAMNKNPSFQTDDFQDFPPFFRIPMETLDTTQNTQQRVRRRLGKGRQAIFQFLLLTGRRFVGLDPCGSQAGEWGSTEPLGVIWAGWEGRGSTKKNGEAWWFKGCRIWYIYI